jgi:predicted ribosome quality control (RQC) complex YloA/Tae2 family protein
MTFSMSSFDIYRMVQEMQGLVGGFLEKAYQPGHTTLMLRFNAPSEEEGRNYEKKDLLIEIGAYMVVGRFDMEMPRTPTTFAMTIRKYLANARVRGIRQHGFERIVVFDLETKDGTYSMVLELFANGNLILVKDEVIIQPLSSKSWRHREVKAKQEFKFPPSMANPLEMKAEELKGLIYGSEKDLVRTLIGEVNLPPRYAEEICLKIGLDKNMPAKTLTPEETDILWSGIKDMLDQLKEGRGGFVYSDAEDYCAVTPIELESLSGNEFKGFDLMSEAIIEFKGHVEEEEEGEEEAGPEVQRLQRQLKTQEDSIQEFAVVETENRFKGESIYGNYRICEETLVSLLKAKEEYGWEEVEKRAEGITTIKQLNTHDGYVIVPLRFEEKDVDVKLDFTLDVNQNATRYYEKAKKAKEKIKGAQVALKETRKKLAKAEKEEVKAEKKEKRQQTKMFWFDRFRWFLSSEGNLVLGGRDATTNDRVVKKHMNSGDRYAHADIHGAPSVVVKKEGDIEIGGETLKEASHFALAYSKAWNAKIGSGSAYWVNAEQVSKTPQSGEYLAKGAFVVRGKRNILADIPLTCAVGEIEYQGTKKIMGGPPSALAFHSKKYCILVPGNTKISDVANLLAKEFNVVVDDILKHMPPGNVDIREKIGF